MSKLLTSSHAVLPNTKYLERSHPDTKIEVSVKFKMDANFQFDKKVMNDFVIWIHNSRLAVPTLVDYESGTVHLTGDINRFEHLFDVELGEYSRAAGGTFRHYEGHLTLPNEFDGKIIAVLGLSTRFRAKSHHRVLEKKPVKKGLWGLFQPKDDSPTQSYYPEQVAKLYNFPPGDGTGQTVGVIELGGGYSLDDLNTYMMGRNLPLPNVVAVSVDGGKNDTSDADASGEVCLDIDVIASIVPKAKVVVYFAGNTDKGFSDAIAFAINDSVNQPKVLSISWGSAEDQYSQQALDAFEQDFAKAVSMGINVYVAAGDSGADDGESNPVTDYPSASPNTISCGGTKIVSTINGQITQEVVWNDGADGGATGGGVSKIFSKPSFQSSIEDNLRHPRPQPNSNGRNTPDISSVSSPNSGFNINVNGQDTVVGGTSGAAPLWSALNVLLNQNLGKNVGWINPILYKNGSVMNDITQGNNGYYSAKVGYDNCSGWGTPNGSKLLAILKQGA